MSACDSGASSSPPEALPSVALPPEIEIPDFRYSAASPPAVRLYALDHKLPLGSTVPPDAVDPFQSLLTAIAARCQETPSELVDAIMKVKQLLIEWGEPDEPMALGIMGYFEADFVPRAEYGTNCSTGLGALYVTYTAIKEPGG